ncbi:hypothetical protein MKW92_003090 [Papaver armeniacum]|nr:hypothetical protein MKW92_003090 [Papaver armeniacum]
MKRRADEDPDLVAEEDERLKKKRKKKQKRERSERKRRADEDPSLVTEEDERLKKKRKKKLKEEDDEHEIGLGNLNEDLKFEVLKLLDAESLATAACVNKKWSEMAKDDRLWEFIVTRRWCWANVGCRNRDFCSYVRRTGGFRSFFYCVISNVWEKLTSSSVASSSSKLIWGNNEVEPNTDSGDKEVILGMYVLCVFHYEKRNLSRKMEIRITRKRNRRSNCKT